MSEAKIEPPGAVLPWVPSPSPAPSDNAPSAPATPDQSFNDDDVVARQAAQRAAVQRANQDRFVQKTPQSQIVKEQEEVVKAGTFLPAGAQDAETQRLLQRRRALQAASALAAATSDTATGETTATPGRRVRLAPGQPLEEMAALEQRLQAVLTYLEQLEQPQRQQAAHALLPDPNVQLQAVAAQQQRLLLEAKMLLLKLLTCSGFVWLQDWRLTFKRLFARLRRWPRCLPPGQPPDSEADINAFLSWVFAPPALPVDLSDP